MDDGEPRPVDPSTQANVVLEVAVLAIVHVIDAFVAVPLHPSLGVALHEDHVGVHVPWPGKAHLHGEAGLNELVIGNRFTELEQEPSQIFCLLHNLGR